MKQLFSALAVIGIVAACGGSDTSGEPVVEVNEAYIVKPFSGRDVTGGGMTVSVTNGSLTLVGAETDVAESVEFHTMGMEDGRMKMRQVTDFTVNSDAPLVLERGGNHLMFFGLDSSLAVGDEIDVVLQFDDGQGKDQFIVTKMDVVEQGD